MSERIKVGDTVLVWRGLRCCGNSETAGLVFKVARIGHGFGECLECHALKWDSFATEGKRGTKGFPLYTLRKLPPLTEPETVESTDEVTA